jgi:site-specific recombinase XerC
MNSLKSSSDDASAKQGAVVDLIGKGGHIRTVPIPRWVKAAPDQWTTIRLNANRGSEQ